MTHCLHVYSNMNSPKQNKFNKKLFLSYPPSSKDAPFAIDLKNKLISYNEVSCNKKSPK